MLHFCCRCRKESNDKEQPRKADCQSWSKCIGKWTGHHLISIDCNINSGYEYLLTSLCRDKEEREQTIQKLLRERQMISTQIRYYIVSCLNLSHQTCFDQLCKQIAKEEGPRRDSTNTTNKIMEPRPAANSGAEAKLHTSTAI